MSLSTVDDQVIRWRARVDRAIELQPRYPAAAPALRLYAATLRFQSEVAISCKAVLKADTPLRPQIDISSALSAMPGILSVAVKYGPEALAAEAQRLQKVGTGRWASMLAAALSADQSAVEGAEDYFTRACLQPYAEHLQVQFSASNSIRSKCPACGGMAQMSVLRPEGEGASRYLLCCFCLRECLYRRLACPWCGEEDKEKLPRYSAQECTHVYVEACDTCKRYLKAVDMTIDGLAVPLVDEAALAVLDVWSSERGYTKIVRNLLGF